MIKSKLLKKNSGFSAEGKSLEGKGTKKKPKRYPVPEEDSFIPLQEDSEEIKYTSQKTRS